jgi:hypothetical protein
MFDETPDKYPSSVEVTVETSIFPEPLEMTALFKVKSEETIVVAAPVMVACFVPS